MAIEKNQNPGSRFGATYQLSTVNKNNFHPKNDIISNLGFPRLIKNCKRKKFLADIRPQKLKISISFTTMGEESQKWKWCYTIDISTIYIIFTEVFEPILSFQFCWHPAEIWRKKNEKLMSQNTCISKSSSFCLN